MISNSMVFLRYQLKKKKQNDTIHNVDGALFHIPPIVTNLSAKQMAEICFV